MIHFLYDHWVEIKEFIFEFKILNFDPTNTFCNVEINYIPFAILCSIEDFSYGIMPKSICLDYECSNNDGITRILPLSEKYIYKKYFYRYDILGCNYMIQDYNQCNYNQCKIDTQTLRIPKIYGINNYEPRVRNLSLIIQYLSKKTIDYYRLL
jgi:hypothetical protein